MTGLFRLLGLSLITFGVAACSGDDQRQVSSDRTDASQGVDLRGLIGIDKNPPDEFAVSTLKPLELPKDFASLPAPTPGVRSRLEADPIADARAILLGETTEQAATTPVSASESALLAAAGADNSSPDIRNVLETEQAALEAARPSYALENVFPSIRRDANQDAILAASEERVRLTEVLPQREIGSTAVATIPAASASAAAVAAPAAAAAPTVTAPAAALPEADAATAGELIFIPE